MVCVNLVRAVYSYRSRSGLKDFSFKAFLRIYILFKMGVVLGFQRLPFKKSKVCVLLKSNSLLLVNLHLDILY